MLESQGEVSMPYAIWIIHEGRRPLAAQFRLDAPQRKLSISRF